MFSHLRPDSLFPFASLPPIMRGAVGEVVQQTSAPVALVAGSALAAASIAVQDVIDVERPNGIGRGPISLYVLTIAASGERKSTVDKLFFDPIIALERQRQTDFEHARQVVDGEIVAWNAKAHGLKSKLRDTVQSGRPADDIEALIAEHQRMKPVPPSDDRILFTDTTPGALFRSLAHGRGSGALHTNEAGGLVNGRGFADIPTLCAIWDGQDLKVDRLERGGSFLVRNPRLTCSLMIQPTWFARFCQHHDGIARSSGLLPRMLLSRPPSTIGHRPLQIHRVLTRQSLDLYNGRIADLLKKQCAHRERRVITFDAEAAELWMHAYNEIEACLRPGNVWCAIPDYASKAPENIARLSAIFNFIENDSIRITQESVRSAINVIGWYLVQFDLMFGRTRHLNDDNELGQTLLRWLISWSRQYPMNNFIATRDLSRYGPDSLRKKSAWAPAVEWLQWRNLASLQPYLPVQRYHLAKGEPRSIIIFHQNFFSLRNGNYYF